MKLYLDKFNPSFIYRQGQCIIFLSLEKHHDYYSVLPHEVTIPGKEARKFFFKTEHFLIEY